MMNLITRLKEKFTEINVKLECVLCLKTILMPHEENFEEEFDELNVCYVCNVCCVIE